MSRTADTKGEILPFEGTMSSTEHCPVCGATMDHYDDFMGFTRMEDCYDCPNGHYSSEFVTGMSRLTIGDHQWAWGYRDAERGCPTRAGTENAIILAKARFRDAR